MGHAIVYCDGCQTRIHGSELESGKAFDYGSGFCCKACVPKLLRSLPAAERERLEAALKRPDPSSASSAARRLPISSTRISLPAVPRPPARGAGLWIGLGAGVLGLLLLAALSLRPSRPPAPPAPKTATSSAAPEASPALREARDYDRRRPEDLNGRIQRWEKAVWASEGRPDLPDAQRGLAAARAERGSAAARDLARIDAEVRPLVERESFGAALDLLDRARRRFEHPEWTLPVDRRQDELRASIAAKFDALLDDVRRARERNAEPELRAAAARVERWAMPQYSTSLQALLAPAPAAAPPRPAPPPPPPAVDRYTPVFEKALALAGRRDYAAAVKELEAAPEGAADLELLKRAAGVPAEAKAAVSRWPRGQKQAVEFLDLGGRSTRLESPFLRLEEARLHFEAQVVELGELAPSTLASLYLGRPGKAPGDERAALAFCLIEGDVEGAGRLPKAELAPRYWDWGRRMAAERAGGREAEARTLFVTADDVGDDPARAGLAAATYRELLERFGDTAFVSRNRASIAALASPPRELVFGPEDLRGAGAFRFAKGAWTMERDAPGHLEIAYAAPAGAEYRAWVYAGGCCLETFEFAVEAGGPRTPARIPFFLRKTHASHGGGPRTASRWDWIPVPAPTAGEGGPRTLRISSERQGFSAAYVVLTLRDGAPKLLEVKERERVRAAREPGPPPAAGLIGHWAFDEGQGDAAADASPRAHHAAVSGAAWTSGRLGGALRFDGVDSHVELPSSPALDRLQAGDYTLAAWFKPEALPAGKDSQNDAAYGLIVKKGHHIGLVYWPGAFHGGHWYDEKEAVGAGTPGGACPPGLFYHAAATYEHATAQARIYVNGRLSGSGIGSPGRNARDFKDERWRIGCAAPGAGEWRWAAKGVIDDVRLYDRALSAAEVRALASGRAPAAAPAQPADERPWTSRPLDKFAGTGFRLENGVLARIPDKDTAGRSPFDFGDLELRIRFECTVAGYLYFAVRQSGEGAYIANFNRGDLERMSGGERELRFVCKGDAVTATLDGRPVTVERRGGQPRSGALQFNMNSPGELRIRSIETREPR